MVNTVVAVHIYLTHFHTGFRNNNKYNFPSSEQKKGFIGKKGLISWGLSAHHFSVIWKN